MHKPLISLERPIVGSQRPIGARIIVRSVAGQQSKGFGNGFGAQQGRKPSEDTPVENESATKVKKVRSKGKQQMRPPGQGYNPPTSTFPTAKSQSEDGSLVEQLEFEERLKALKAESAQKKASISNKISSANSVLDGPSAPSYDNPPPLSSTLFGSNEGTNAAADREYSGSSLGPSQIGLAVASLALVGIFIVTSGGSDLGYAQRSRASSSTSETQLGPEQQQELRDQLMEVSKRLESDANDLEALEAAAVLHARLGELSDAEQQLERLTTARPGDVDAWRLLAETRSQAGEISGAVEAYAEGFQASDRASLEILTGLCSALVVEGKPQAAVDQVRSLLASDKAKPQLGEVELGLLLAKTYGQWQGHGADAMTQYDALSEAYPDDFRPPLGKGLLLREQGREGDAQRYILQAKFLAPPSSRPVVDALVARR
jgi:Flp pilus assembly protein TadD